MLGKILRGVERKTLERLRIGTRLSFLSPNTYSLLSLACAVVAGVLIALQHNLAGFLGILASITCDLIDGAVARSTKKQSAFGAYLDPVVDTLAETAIYAGLFVLFPIEAFIAITGILIIGAAKNWAFSVIPLKNFDWPGIGERTDRYLILLAALATSTATPTVGDLSLLRIALWLIGVLVWVGVIQRILFARRIIENF